MATQPDDAAFEKEFGRYRPTPASVPATTIKPIIGGETPEQAAARRAEEERKAAEEARKAAAAERERIRFEEEQKAGGGAKPTEAQQKTLTLLTRIAGGNEAIKREIKLSPEAQEAGLGETLSRNIFGEGLITRSISGESRRIVTDAQADILDGLLTLGTGAAYTPEQLRSQTVSYFPQYGDTERERQEKNRRLDALIQSARIQAGPLADKFDEVIKPLIGAPSPTAAEAPAPGAAPAPTPGVAPIEAGKPFQTEQDLAIQRQLQDAWNAGRSVDEIIQLNQQLGRGAFAPEDVARMREQRAKGGPMSFYASPTGQPAEEQGFFEGLVETVTGSERSTPEIEALPDWTTMPELNELSIAGARTGLGTMFSSPEESVQIIKTNYPGVQVRQDSKGNYILRSQDGREYGIKPGFRWSDVPRALGGILAFTPAGRAATLPGAVGGAALTQAGIEATQAGAGGEFNPREVVMAGVGGAGGKLIEEVIPLAVQGVRRITRGPEVPPIGGIAPEAPPTSPTGAAPPPAGTVVPEVPTPAPPRAPSVAEQQGISEEMVSLARQAAGRGPRSSSARAKLRAAVEADPTLIQQAEAIGLELPADVFSANVQLKNLTGLARSQPGSAAEAGWQQTVSNSAQQVEQSLAEMGASRDLAGLSDEVFTRLNGNMQSLERQGDNLREAVNAKLNMQSRVEATNLQEALAQTINDLGGIEEATQAMTSQERRLLQALGVGETPKQPTYAYMDRLRREIGQALNKGTGPWADTERVTLQRYYNALAEDRIAHVARELGQDAADDLAASNQIFQAMYAARDEMTNLFGRDLDKGIGAQIRSVIAQGARGDTTNLRRLMAIIPEDMRANVAFSGILANARSRGAEGGFNFANFRNTYRSIRENEPVYRELARNMTESQRKFLENLNAVSEGISDAQRRIIPTGRARGGPAAEINAQSLTQKVVEQATRRGVGAGTGMLGGTLLGDVTIGIPMAVALESSLAYLGRGGVSNLDRVSEVIGSAAYRDLVNEAAQGRTSIRAINRLANSKPFGLFARTLGLNNQDARRTWIRSALAAGTAEASEQSEPIQPKVPAGAIMVRPQQ